MDKAYLFVVLLIQFFMGGLGSVTFVTELMEENYTPNLLFAAILALFGFYLGINSFRKLFGKADRNDENGQEKCSGG